MPGPRQYKDFTIELSDYKPGGSYRVAMPPSGRGEIDPVNVKLRLEEQQFQLNKLANKQILPEQLVKLGKWLTDRLLPGGRIRQRFIEEVKACSSEQGVRLRLIIRDLALQRIPWEYTYLPIQPGEEGPMHFLVLQPAVSLVRHPPMNADQPIFSPLDGPARLLVAMANTDPGDGTRLDLKKELTNLEQALSNVSTDRIELEWKPALTRATQAELEAALVKKPDLFHFSGHGEFDTNANEASILLLKQKNSREAIYLKAPALAKMLQQAGVRLAYLGACESSLLGEETPWASMAPALVAAGLPAVVAMQYKILDEDAIHFAQAFYQALAVGYSLDEAVSNGRLRILANSNETRVEWGAPTLYMRAMDGVLFPRTIEETRSKRGEFPILGKGALPTGYNLPFTHNKVFTGREKDLEDLWELLKPDGQQRELGVISALRAVAVSGMGGIGKTQLAVEFCYRYGRYYAGVHWLAANTSMEGEIADCGQKMGLQPWPEKQAEQVARTLNAWQSGGRRLVVLDNVDDQQVVADWLPRLGNASVLITTRQAEWPVDLPIEVHPLGFLAHKESRELLRKSAPRLISESDVSLDRLAGRLSDLPLALDLAGRYLKDNSKLAIDAYLKELDEGEGALEHSSLKDWTEHNPTQHATSLAATFLLGWKKLFEQKKGDSPANWFHQLVQKKISPQSKEAIYAQRIFIVYGYLTPNKPIPMTLLEAVFQTENTEDKRRVRPALKRLYDLGLLIQENDLPIIHPLLAEFARAVDKYSQTGLWDLLNGLNYLAYQSNWIRLLEDKNDLVFEENETAEAFKNLGYGSPEGISVGIVSSEWRLPPAIEHITPTQILSLVGEILSIPGYAFTWSFTNIFFPPKPPTDLSPRYMTIGTLFKSKGDLSEARMYYDQALAIRLANYGDQHADTAKILNMIGRLIQLQGNYKEARRFLQQSYDIYQSVLGDQHPNTIASLNNLGVLLYEENNIQTAREIFERVIQMSLANRDQDSLSLARYYWNLGMAIKQQNDFAIARSAFEKALDLYNKSLPPGNPLILGLRTDLESLPDTNLPD